jgi:glutaredoxin
MLIQVYTKNGCGACDVAKRQLNERQLTFMEIRCPEDISLEDMKAKFPTARTFPVVLVDGRQVRSPLEIQILTEKA